MYLYVLYTYVVYTPREEIQVIKINAQIEFFTIDSIKYLFDSNDVLHFKQQWDNFNKLFVKHWLLKIVFRVYENRGGYQKL